MQNIINSNLSISIITATWNCFETITDCLDSVASQTYKNYEHIVVDGGSSDGTVEVLNMNREKLAVFISEPDLGIYDALNKGIAQSSGNIIGFLHADDFYGDVKSLENIAEIFKDPSVCGVYGDLQYVSKSNINKIVRQWRSSSFNPNKLRWGWMPPHPTLYVRRDWYMGLGRFDINYHISADYFSILSMFSNEKFKSVYIPRVLVKMRTGGESNKSLKNLFLKSREDLNALRRSGVGGIWSLFAKNISKISQFFNI